MMFLFVTKELNLMRTVKKVILKMQLMQEIFTIFYVAKGIRYFLLKKLFKIWLDQSMNQLFTMH